MNFSERDHVQGTLHGPFALLGTIFSAGSPYFVMRFLSVVCALIVFILICVDWIIYDNTPQWLENTKGDPVAWPLYGTNQAVCVSLAYFVVRVWYSFGLQKMVHVPGQEPEPFSHMGRLVWMLYTLSIPAIWLSLILYVPHLRNLTGFRASQEVSYAMVFGLVTLNMLLSRTPLLIKHLPFWIMTLAGHLAMTAAYEYVTRTRVYPFNSWGEVGAVMVLGVIVYLGPAALLEGRDVVFGRCCKTWVSVWHTGKGLYTPVEQA